MHITVNILRLGIWILFLAAMFFVFLPLVIFAITGMLRGHLPSAGTQLRRGGPWMRRKA